MLTPIMENLYKLYRHVQTGNPLVEYDYVIQIVDN